MSHVYNKLMPPLKFVSCAASCIQLIENSSYIPLSKHVLCVPPYVHLSFYVLSFMNFYTLSYLHHLTPCFALDFYGAISIAWIFLCAIHVNTFLYVPPSLKHYVMHTNFVFGALTLCTPQHFCLIHSPSLWFKILFLFLF
jgi:hypothetical protein